MGDAGSALQRCRRHLVVTLDAGDLLYEMRRPVDIAAPGRNRYFVAGQLEAEAFQDFALARLGNIDSAERHGPAEVERDGAFLNWRVTHLKGRRRLAAANVDNQPGQDREAIVE